MLDTVHGTRVSPGYKYVFWQTDVENWEKEANVEYLLNVGDECYTSAIRNLTRKL